MKRSSTIGFAMLAALPACGVGLDETAAQSPIAIASLGGAPPVSGCPLDAPDNRIQHVIYLQFDNVHFRRDNPRVPSDLEQMPHLLDFITQHGTLLSDHHTPLISHTAGNLLTSLTGVYGDRHGQPVSNSFAYFTPPGVRPFGAFASSFAYWTNVVNPALDPRPNMIGADGKIAPAPWVAFTRAGCNVGAAAIANIDLENVGADVVNVFGAASAEAAEARADPAKAAADFVGIAVHCAADSALCGAANGGRPDLLPDEPGGYLGFNALYGHKFVAPLISPDGPLSDLDGMVMTNAAGNIGFPGFGVGAAQTLAYVAAMHEHGVPVTFAYISDVHDDHATGLALGPGEPAYVAQLAAYDRAWSTFFDRLSRDGITRDNTLFVFTADENDHFVGGPPSPADCDGIHTPCSYAQLGELEVNVTQLLVAIDPSLAAAPVGIRPDMAPTFYVQNAPVPGSPLARAYERAAAQLTAVSPLDGQTDTLAAFLADPVEMKLLHMVTADPQRTPTFVLFGHPDYFFVGAGISGVFENRAAAWNHGGVQPDITTTWLGLVGPGVRRQGVDGDTFSDHTDIRPTILLLAGLTDDYVHDGVALVEDLHEHALPRALREDAALFGSLARAYKQITAPLGELGRQTLAVSTTALAGDDPTYAALEAALTAISDQRDALAAQMIAVLDGAEFHGQRLRRHEVHELLAQAHRLLAQVRALSR
jgi:arylsulfatase A-like enzyme